MTAKPRLLDVFESRLRLEGTLTTRTGLHIGAGGSHDILATDAPVVRDAAGQPFIPGASLKGVIRSATEALIRGREGGGLPGGPDHLWACNFIAGDAHACISKDRLRELRETNKEDSRVLAEAVWAESCPVCRLFGSSALASRIRFPDLPLASDLPPMELRNGVGIERDKQLAAQGVLYDFEAVPPGTAFRLTLILDNYEEFEAGLVLYLFQQLTEGNLALGGKTSRGLGLVRVQWQNGVETDLKQGNPFTELLDRREVVRPSGTAQAEDGTGKGDDATAQLPATGDGGAWQQLAGILRELPQIEKTALGQAAAGKDLNKEALNQQLGLGLDLTQKKQKGLVWDRILDALVASGFLVLQEGQHYVAGREPQKSPSKKTKVQEPEAATDPAIQALENRLLEAMAKRWQEEEG